jgi:enamine deaminase RidA (YjgF/YER057c/UK114 family)
LEIVVNPEDKLRELGIALPSAPAAVGAYDPWVRTGNLIVTSGQLPWQDGKLVCTGKLGTDVTIEQGYQAARTCAINAVAQLKAAVGDLDKVVRIVRLDGFVQSGPGFQDQPKVLNGASELFNQVFGPRGRHTRTAIGISEMPLNAPVQLAVIAEVS